jgi:hypothetical protein
LPPPVPESGGPLLLPPQVPCVLPTGTTHVCGAQQSALMVQLPLFGTHAALHLPSTQGWPQQSALVAQS